MRLRITKLENTLLFNDFLVGYDVARDEDLLVLNPCVMEHDRIVVLPSEGQVHHQAQGVVLRLNGFQQHGWCEPEDIII